MAAPNATRENFRKLGRAFMTAVPGSGNMKRDPVAT